MVKDLTQNKVTRINSLGLKFSALVFMAVLLTGLSITHFYTSYQQQSLQQQQQQSIARTADNYQKQFEHYLLSLELKALRAQQILLRHLTERAVGTLPASEALPVNDGSWRQRDEWSGVFAPQGRPANKAQPILQASALAWQQMM
ncbi:MAG: hypothetical protein B7Z18_09115, partial [Alishewanella sp. 32-51-5]